MAGAYGNAYGAYKNNSVNYASKEQLLLMLVDGAVKYAKIGRQAIVDKKVQKAHENIIRTQDIFYELIVTMDVNKGGEWAKNLVNIYQFIIDRLSEANMSKDIKIMDEIIPLIEDIRDTWYEAEKLAKANK